MKTIWKSILVYLTFFLVVGCQTSWIQPVPNTEIVYETGNFENKEIGFINGDGTNPELLKLGFYLAKPTWSQDRNRIYSLSINSIFETGSPSYWGGYITYKKCPKWFNFDQVDEVINIDGSRSTLIVDKGLILLADLDRCEQIEVLLDISEHGELSVNGVSYLPDERWLFYGLQTGDGNGIHRNYQIIKKDIEAVTTIELAKGINPTLSPNGTQIVYIQNDGIYIMNADGSQQHQLIVHNFVDGSGWFGFMAPLPRWSPDEKWIIYHRCDQYSCILKENTIYKANVETGKEEKIIFGGAYPDWK